MASGGSHLLLCPSPLTQASHQPPSLAGCRRSPELPGCRAEGSGCSICPHSAGAGRLGGAFVCRMPLLAPHPTPAIRTCALPHVPGARREPPHGARPALQSGFALSGPLVFHSSWKVLKGAGAEIFRCLLKTPLQGTGHHGKGLPMDMVSPSSSMKSLLEGYYLG